MIPYRLVGKTPIRPYGTFALVVLLALFFVWEMWLTIQAAQPIESLLSGYVWQTCEVGQVSMVELAFDGFRSTFMHLSFVHLVTNILFLWIFAPPVEAFLGHRRFMTFFVLGGLGGSMLTTVASGGECYMVVGANGAVSAVLGGFFILRPWQLVDAYVPVVNRTFALPALIFMIGYLTIMVFASEGGPLSGQLAPYWDEVGGFLTGLVFLFVGTMLKPAPAIDPFAHLDD